MTLVKLNGFIHLHISVPCYTGQCKKAQKNNTWGPPLNSRDRKTVNNYNTALKTLTEIISTYVYMYNYIYNWRALITLRFIRDFLYAVLLSLKA